MSLDYVATYPSFRFDRTSDGALRITLDPPVLNAVSPGAHREIAEVWRSTVRDPEVRVAVLQGAGKGFSAGGSFDLLEGITSGYAVRTRVMREARDLVWNVINCSKAIVSAIHGPAVGAGLVAGLLADISIVGRTTRIIDGHTRLGVAAGDHAAARWPLLAGMAQAALRLTKHTLNHWCRSAGPAFDASLAYEFYGFGGPDAAEGLAPHREKRIPIFSGPTSE
jgi:enoyl-CoA hydratase